MKTPKLYAHLLVYLNLLQHACKQTGMRARRITNCESGNTSGPIFTFGATEEPAQPLIPAAMLLSFALLYGPSPCALTTRKLHQILASRVFVSKGLLEFLLVTPGVSVVSLWSHDDTQC